MTHATPGREDLLAALAPVLERVAALAPQTRTTDDAISELEAELSTSFPIGGAVAQSIRGAIEAAIAEGWLCDRGAPEARFSRLAKPTPRTHDLSVDVVSLEGAAVRHTHPAGEITLGFPAPGTDDTVRFDGRPVGWVFCRPGSTHTPTVEGGRMNLIYFLPGGAVQWSTESA